MVGFGSMMLARHQGLRSLGQVLTLGVFCCLVTSLIMLPALLALFSANRATRERKDAAEDGGQEGDEDDGDARQVILPVPPRRAITVRRRAA